MAAFTEQSVTLHTGDNHKLASTVFKPANTNGSHTLVIGSALGVPRYFYFKFARYFAENGYSVVTFDYRGIYESRETVSSGSKITMEEWGSRDIEAALQYARETLHADKLFYLGHSCGGQLLGLAPNSIEIDRVAFIACQLGYWKLWSRPLRYGVFLTWQLLFMMVPFFEYIPAKMLGISSLNLPSGVARQWADWGTSPGYLFNKKHGLDTSRYAELRCPILSYHFEDDILLAPPKAVDALLAEYTAAPITKRSIKPGALNQEKIGHFGYFKERLRETLWQETLGWFNGTEPGQTI